MNMTVEKRMGGGRGGAQTKTWKLFYIETYTLVISRDIFIVIFKT